MHCDFHNELAMNSIAIITKKKKRHTSTLQTPRTQKHYSEGYKMLQTGMLAQGRTISAASTVYHSLKSSHFPIL